MEGSESAAFAAIVMARVGARVWPSAEQVYLLLKGVGHFLRPELVL